MRAIFSDHGRLRGMLDFEAALACAEASVGLIPHNVVADIEVLGKQIAGLVSTMFVAMPQEHERGLGLWHAEWETLPELCCLVSGSLQQALQVVPGAGNRRRAYAQQPGTGQGAGAGGSSDIALARRIGRDTAPDGVRPSQRRRLLAPGPDRLFSPTSSRLNRVAFNTDEQPARVVRLPMLVLVANLHQIF
jgi:adenylosuccinate lyase